MKVYPIVLMLYSCPHSLRQRIFTFATCFFILATTSRADNWPTYLKDYQRSGASTEVIKPALKLKWSFRSADTPKAAWRAPNPDKIEGVLEANRVDFDRAFQVIAANGLIYFGSSSDDQVYCLDQNTGEIRWSFFTEGPVRLAPTYSNGRLYFGSDDGWLYCLNATTGETHWKVLIGPNNRRLLGNSRMISRWPIRTDVIVENGIAYVGAGTFPYEGVYIAAYDAKTGRLIWRNFETGEQNGNRGGFSPQGYQLISKDLLYVPSGRALPAGFDRKTGKKKFQSRSSWRAAGIVGGTYATLVDGQIISGANQNVAFDATTGRPGQGWFEARRMVVDGETSYLGTKKTVKAINRNQYAAGTRKYMEMRGRHDGRSKEDPQYLWSVRRSELRGEKNKIENLRSQQRIDELEKEIAKYRSLLDKMEKEEADYDKSFKAEATHWTAETSAEHCLIAAQNILFAGGDDTVTGIDSSNGKKVWSTKVEGAAAGLAISNGSLLVSTDKGVVYCFSTEESESKPKEIKQLIAPSGKNPERQKALTILKETGINKGFAFVSGLKDGQLAAALAQQSDLTIICVDSNAERIAKARATLVKAGLYGSRVAVIHSKANQLPLPNYFANLVISETSELPLNPEAIAKVVRPLGGTVYLKSESDTALMSYLQTLKFGESQVSDSGYTSVTRGKLPGAGSWSHPYGSPNNTSSNNETRLKAPLGVLWYGDPGATQMINRHSAGSPPVALDGRLFIVGVGVVLAYDAYNGTKLWEQKYTGAPRTRTRAMPSSLITSPDGVFLAMDKGCLHMDTETGKILRTIAMPNDADGRRRHWLYLGYHNGVLVGTSSDSLRNRYSQAVFGFDAKSGKHLWTYQGEHIAQLTLAMGDGQVFFVDSKMTIDARDALLKQDMSELKKLTGKAKQEAEAKVKAMDLRTAVALDVKSGKQKWSKALDLTDCSGTNRSHGELTLMYKNGLLVFSGASGNGHFWDQYIAGEFKHRQVKVVNAVNGSNVWKADANYRIRPIVVGDTVIAEPWAYDLYTGKQKTRSHPMTGEDVPWQYLRTGHHCGHVAATENLMFFRSATTAFYDLAKDSGVSHFGGIRPGCSINIIPANGLVHIPEASAGCQCLFSIQSTVTLEPVSEAQDRAWSIYNTPGATLPVKHLYLNLGAPGDRRDVDGKLWFAYPRPSTSRSMEAIYMDLGIKTKPTRIDVARLSDENIKVTKTDKPWLYRNGLEDNFRMTIPMMEKKHKPGVYMARFHLSEDIEKAIVHLRSWFRTVQESPPKKSSA